MVNKNTCMRRLSISFSAVLGVLGGVVLTLGAIAPTYQNEAGQFNEETSTGAALFIVVGIITLLVSLLGIYAAYCEKRILLRLFCGMLSGGIIVIFIFIAQLTSYKKKIELQMEAEFKRLTPLNSAAPKIQDVFGEFQTAFKCCGYSGYQDWKGEIPESCKCPSYYSHINSECQTVKINKKTHSYGYGATQMEMPVYKKPCGPILIQSMDSGINTVLGLSCAFLVIMIVLVILSLALCIHKRTENHTNNNFTAPMHPTF